MKELRLIGEIEALGRAIEPKTAACRHLSCAETAKLVRAALAQKFHGVAFSVTSSTYSMGASISVSWTDGPTAAEVNPTLGRFEGAGFDGMIDLKYSVTAWLMPDGTPTFARSSGTEGSMGMVPAGDELRPHPEAEQVSFGSDYVHSRRSESVEFYNRLAPHVARRFGTALVRFEANKYGSAQPIKGDGEGDKVNHKGREYSPSQIVYAVACETSAAELSAMEQIAGDVEVFKPAAGTDVTGAKVEAYDLLSRRGRYLRKASKVVWPDGSVLKLTQKASNREALRLAALPCNADSIERPQPAVKPRYRWDHVAQKAREI